MFYAFKIFPIFIKWPSWMDGGPLGCNSERGPPKNHSCQVWFIFVQWFWRRRLKYDLFTDNDGRMPSDGKSSHCLWQGELKTIHFFCFIHTKYTRIWLFEITLNMTQKVALPSITSSHTM